VILAGALADPASADLAEIALMGSEKAVAAAASAEALARAQIAAGTKAVDQAMTETERALDAAARLAGARTPVEAACIQADYLAQWLARAGAAWAEAQGAAVQAQQAALGPLHAAATANARRLRRG